MLYKRKTAYSMMRVALLCALWLVFFVARSQNSYCEVMRTAFTDGSNKYSLFKGSALNDSFHFIVRPEIFKDSEFEKGIIEIGQQERNTKSGFKYKVNTMKFLSLPLKNTSKLTVDSVVLSAFRNACSGIYKSCFSDLKLSREFFNGVGKDLPYVSRYYVYLSQIDLNNAEPDFKRLDITQYLQIELKRLKGSPNLLFIEYTFHCPVKAGQ